jgi:hypothetical protein
MSFLRLLLYLASGNVEDPDKNVLLDEDAAALAMVMG